MVLWSGVDSVKVKMGQSRTESKNQESGFIFQHALLTVPSFLPSFLFLLTIFFLNLSFSPITTTFFPPLYLISGRLATSSSWMCVQCVWIEGEGRLNYGWGFIGAGGLSGPIFTVPYLRSRPASEHPCLMSLTRGVCVCLFAFLPKSSTCIKAHSKSFCKNKQTADTFQLISWLKWKLFK